MSAGARRYVACQEIGLSVRSLQRWEKDTVVKIDGRMQCQHIPGNKLTNEERQTVLDVISSQEFAHLPPSQIVPRLADQGLYIASESTMYRIMRKENMLAQGLQAVARRSGSEYAHLPYANN